MNSYWVAIGLGLLGSWRVWSANRTGRMSGIMGAIDKRTDPALFERSLLTLGWFAAALLVIGILGVSGFIGHAT